MKDKMENTMLVLEVYNADEYSKQLAKLDKSKKYEKVRIIPGLHFILFNQ